MTASAWRRRRGATLVENLIALTVFSIGLLGIVQMNVLSMGQNALANRQSGATTIGRDLVDTFERLPFDHPAMLPTNGTPRELTAEWGAGELPLLGAAQAIVSSDGYTGTGSKYSVSWTVTEDFGSVGIKPVARLVTINVSFRVPSGSTKTVSFICIKYNPSVILGGTGRFHHI